jgi:hypothetical protein
MKDKHIIDLLDSGSLAILDASQRTAIEDHAQDCPDCHKALAAAYVCESLLRERTAESFSAPPFFATRVLATRRERTAKDAWGLGRMWRAAGALVSSMAVTVVVLGVISFMAPVNETAFRDTLSAYSADAAILDWTDEQVSDGQVLNTLYEVEEEAAK